ERLTAFLLDLFIWILGTLALYLLLIGVANNLGGNTSKVAFSIGLFIAFIVRNCYFVYFELAWRGATPGKRIVGIRVIDRNGGPLVASAVIARNLTREVEMFIPVGILLHGQAGSGGDWQRLAICGWVMVCLAIAAFSR